MVETQEKPKVRRGRLLFLIIVAVAVIGCGGWLISRLKSSAAGMESAPATFTLQRRDLTISVSESGEIKALQSTDIKSEVEGRTTIVYVIPEGTIITQKDVDNGLIIVKLDSSNLEERINQQEIVYASAEASLTEARESYDIQLKQNESDISRDTLNVKFGKMDLQKYLGEKLADEMVAHADDNTYIRRFINKIIKDPNNPDLGGEAKQSFINSINNIDLAKEKQERARDNYSGTKKLYDKKYVSRTELEADRLALKQSGYNLDQAVISMNLLIQYDFPKQVEKLFSDYQEAMRQLERTKAKARSQLAQAKAKLDSAQATYNLQKERLDKLKKQFAACVIRAPRPGMVVYATSGDPWRRRDPIQVGSEVYERQKILTIPNTGEMAADVQVHESWVDKVLPGMKALITVDAFPDMQFRGKVLKVAPLPNPQSRWLNTGLKVYTTEVSIESNKIKLRPGMSAKVDIIIDVLKDVLVVPVQAVANRQNRKFCYLVTDSGLEAREVKTGGFNDSFIQIVEGLQEGDTISLVPPQISKESTAEGAAKAKNARKPQAKKNPASDKIPGPIQPNSRKGQQNISGQTRGPVPGGTDAGQIRKPKRKIPGPAKPASPKKRPVQAPSGN